MLEIVNHEKSHVLYSIKVSDKLIAAGLIECYSIVSKN